MYILDGSYSMLLENGSSASVLYLISTRVYHNYFSKMIFNSILVIQLFRLYEKKKKKWTQDQLLQFLQCFLHLYKDIKGMNEFPFFQLLLSKKCTQSNMRSFEIYLVIQLRWVLWECLVVLFCCFFFFNFTHLRFLNYH